jgi:hypothetical protein
VVTISRSIIAEIVRTEAKRRRGPAAAGTCGAAVEKPVSTRTSSG